MSYRHWHMILLVFALAVASGCCFRGRVMGDAKPCRPLIVPRLFSGGASARPLRYLAELEHPLEADPAALPVQRRRWFHPVPTRPVFEPVAQLPANEPEIPLPVDLPAPLMPAAPADESVEIVPLPDEVPAAASDPAERVADDHGSRPELRVRR